MSMAEPPVQTSVDEVHAHAHRTGHGRLDLVLAFSAIAISLISLFVAIAHGRTEEKLVAASSWPFLDFATTKNGLEAGSRVIELRLQNSGVGPARVQWLRLALDGRPLHDRAEFLARCCGVPPGSADAQVALGLVSQNAPTGVLPAREGITLLAWQEKPGPGAAGIWQRLDAARHRLRLSACYCSVLDECWLSDLTATARPRKVEACAPVADGYAG